MADKFSKDFSNLLENNKNYDVKVKVGKKPNTKEFKAHSLILSCRSNILKVHCPNHGQGKRVESSFSINPTFCL